MSVGGPDRSQERLRDWPGFPQAWTAPGALQVDRSRRRPVLVTTDMGRVLLFIALPVLAFTEHLSLVVLMVLMALSSEATPSSPANRIITPASPTATSLAAQSRRGERLTRLAGPGASA